MAMLVLAFCSGCLKLDADFVVSTEDTVSGEFTFAIARELALAQGFSASDDEPPEVSTGSVDSEAYDDGDYLGTTYTFDEVGLEDINTGAAFGESNSMQLVRVGDEFQLTGGFDLTDAAGGGSAEELAAEAFTDTFDGRIMFTFPGPVTESNGQVDGRSVSWELQLGENNPISAVASAEPGVLGIAMGLPDWALISAGVAVIVVIGVIGLVVVRRSRNRGTAADDMPAYADPPGWGQHPPYGDVPEHDQQYPR